MVSGAGLGVGLHLILAASAVMFTGSTSRDALPPEPLGKGLAPAPLAPAETRKEGDNC